MAKTKKAKPPAKPLGQPRKEVCKHGHALTPDNCYHRTNPIGRECKMCSQGRAAARAAAKKAAAAWLSERAGKRFLVDFGYKNAKEVAARVARENLTVDESR
jgi:hypothetical protein